MSDCVLRFEKSVFYSFLLSSGLISALHVFNLGQWFKHCGPSHNSQLTAAYFPSSCSLYNFFFPHQAVSFKVTKNLLKIYHLSSLRKQPRGGGPRSPLSPRSPRSFLNLGSKLYRRPDVADSASAAHASSDSSASSYSVLVAVHAPNRCRVRCSKIIASAGDEILSASD